MSYNITAWRFGDLRLSLPKDFDFRRWLLAQPDRDEKGSENTGKRWCLEDGTCAVLVDPAARTWTLKLLDPALSGILADDDSLVLTDLRGWTGDGSGYLYSDILIPLFKEFHGILEALVVWEGGDSIKQVKVRNGVVEEEEI